MQLFDRIFRADIESEVSLQLDPNLLATIEALARDEAVPVEAFIEELLYYALENHFASTENLTIWHELTPRQKEAAALICLGYTNDEIAEKMTISTNTVKSHVRRVLTKFDLSSKADLRAMLANWDFAAWLQAQDMLPPDALDPTPPGSPP